MKCRPTWHQTYGNGSPQPNNSDLAEYIVISLVMSLVTSQPQRKAHVTNRSGCNRKLYTLCSVTIVVISWLMISYSTGARDLWQ